MLPHPENATCYGHESCTTDEVYKDVWNSSALDLCVAALMDLVLIGDVVQLHVHVHLLKTSLNYQHGSLTFRDYPIEFCACESYTSYC